MGILENYFLDEETLIPNLIEFYCVLVELYCNSNKLIDAMKFHYKAKEYIEGKPGF